MLKWRTQQARADRKRSKRASARSNSPTTSPTAIRPTRRSTSFTTSVIFNGPARPISGPFRRSRLRRGSADSPRTSAPGTDRSSRSCLYEARRGILTANATTPYYLGFADLSAGPLVLEMPARGVQGGINDAWQRTIPGTESPGKYLVLAPGQKAPDNVAGYIVRQLADLQHLSRCATDRPRSGECEGGAGAAADVSLRATRQSAEDGDSGRGREGMERPAAARDGILGAAR